MAYRQAKVQNENIIRKTFSLAFVKQSHHPQRRITREANRTKPKNLELRKIESAGTLHDPRDRTVSLLSS
jgi:hypothetical protein